MVGISTFGSLVTEMPLQVFAINNPDPEGLTFQAFQQAAIATNATGPSNPSGTIIAGTPGAFDSPLSLPAGTLPTTAQAPSAPTSSSLTSQITPSITSSTTTPISASASSSTRGPLNVGPVVGGVIAALVLLITAGLFVFIRIRRRKAARTRSLIDLTDDDMPPHRPLTPWTVTAFRQMESLASSNKVNSARRTPAALDNKTPTEGSRNLGLERPHHVNADATIQSPDMPQEEDPVGQFPYAVQQQGQISTDLTTEEGVLLRELQIIRRLQEIRIGDVPVPPPEYE
ncbi:hypothetical protein BDP27DRAFT_1333926 [Rhodocollybia butyracea]|uniref:Transmembrane protein n=1 Tax=Rhodocollybia butyracea TaxID=206335 RepID=A0A9P5PLE0_9AGAR|nr:hypothetical protein BDP27DRAFT_1333926 [Rhodocollybia butyracea]